MASGTPVVKLGDVILGGASSYGWPLTSGTSPHREFWTVSASRIQDIQPLMGKPQTFVIEGLRKTYEVRDLYPLRILPNSNPNLKTLEVVDKRWLLPRKHIVRHYNIRRTTGRKTFNDDGGNLQEENAVFDAAIEFASYSLSLGTEPWTPRGALAHLLLSLFGTKFEIPDAVFLGDAVEIRDLVIDDAGDAALSIMLNQFPGASIYIDREGNAVVYDTQSGYEQINFDKVKGRAQDIGSVAEVVDYQHVRPSSVRVLFTPEIEVRLDVPTTRTLGNLELDQIVQSVDGRLEVTDPLTGQRRVAGLGSWEEATSVYAAWGPFGVQSKEVSNAELAVHAASGFKLSENAWTTDAAGTPNDQSARRIASAVHSYRRDFALDTQAWGYLESLLPHRVAFLNRLLGSRAPSPVYTDWIRIPSYKGFSAQLKRGWNVAGGVGVSDALSSGQRAPAQVYQIGPGMYRIEPQQQDFGGLVSATFFGRPADDMPANDLGGEANRTAEDYYAASEFVRLQPQFRASTIMTAIPGAPNNERKLYEVEVEARDALFRVGVFGVESKGPPMTIRIPASWLTAKFAYSDDQRTLIENVVLQRPEDDGQGAPLVNSLEPLLANPDFVSDFAKAAAAVVYSQFVDRPLGTHSVDMDPSLHPDGSLSEVRHEMVDGVTRSVLRFTEPSQLANVFRFLDQGIRRRLLTGGETNTGTVS